MLNIEGWHRDFPNPYEEEIKNFMNKLLNGEPDNDGSIVDLCEKTLQKYADGFERGYITTCESIQKYLLKKAMDEL